MMGDYYPTWRPYLSPRFLASKLREMGLWLFLQTGARICSRQLHKLIMILLFKYPLYYMGVRFTNMAFWLIGHFATDPDCFIKEGILGMRPKFKEIWLVYPKSQVVNPCLLDYWRKHVRIITSPFLCVMLKPLSQDKKLQYDVDPYINTRHTGRFGAIQKAWGDRPPILSLTESHRKRGWDNLRQLGVPEDAWFATVHCKEPGFHRILRPGYAAAQAHKDADIDTYIPAMKAIIERGGWCIRVGDPTMKPLPQMDNVIDYVHLDIKSDWMDIFLLASSKFHLGGSGVYAVSLAFGVPFALSNGSPMASFLLGGPRDMGIPKLVWSNVEGRLLTFQEILGTPIGQLHQTSDYDEAGVKVIDNSQEDIRDLAIEMFDRIEGKAVYTAQDEQLQKRFISLLKPGHLSYGGSSRVGRDFLRKYAMLLPNQEL